MVVEEVSEPGQETAPTKNIAVRTTTLK